MIVDELVTILGIDIAASALPNVTKFNSKLDSVIRYAEGVAAAVAATGVAVVAFVEKMSSSAADLDKFSQYTGMSTDKIQQWSYAVEQAGGHAASIKGDLVALEKALNPVMPGAYNQGLFMMFGTHMKDFKDGQEALMAISDRMQGMTKQRQMQWGDMLGLNPETMLLVQQGPKAIRGYFQEIKANLITADQAKHARQFQMEWNKLKFSFYKTGENIVTSLLPGIMKVLHAFDGWLNRNRELIQSGLDRFIRGVGDGFSRFADGLSGLKDKIPIIGKLFEIMMDPKVISGTVLAALTGISLVLGVIAAKYVLIGAAVMSVIGAVEDFSAAATDKDEDTYTGRASNWLYKKMPDWMKDEKYAPKDHSNSKEKSWLINAATGIKQLMDATTQNSYKTNMNYLRKKDPALADQLSGGGVTNHNTVIVNGSPDAYQTGGEAVYQLKRLTGADFQGRTVSGNGQ